MVTWGNLCGLLMLVVAALHNVVFYTVTALGDIDKNQTSYDLRLTQVVKMSYCVEITLLSIVLMVLWAYVL